MPFNSDNLQLFLTVLEKGSFSAAARALYRVPSAVSMAVSNLEAELGFALFERSGRAPVPTERALALAPYAREITDKIYQLNVFTRELTQDVESTLAVGVATCVNPQDLFSALQILNQRYPLLKTEILSGSQDDILPLLHQGRIQLALVFGGLYVDPREQFHCIGHEALVATISATHPSLSQQQSVYIEDLVQAKQIVIASLHHSLTDVRSQMATKTWQTDNFSVALGLVKAGIGWGNLPESMIRAEVASGTLKVLSFRNTRNGLVLPVHIVSRKGDVLKRGAQECIGLLTESRVSAGN